MKLRVEFFENQINQAVEAGIYSIYLEKEGRSRLLYIGESTFVIERCSQHLGKVSREPIYLGLTSALLDDSSLALRFELYETIAEESLRKNKEKELVKSKQPLLQSGISDRVVSDEDKQARVRQFLTGDENL